MLILCKDCGVVNSVNEIYDLKDNDKFTYRSIYISKCKRCNQLLIQVVECRKSDEKIFIDNLVGSSAEKYLKKVTSDLIAKVSKRDDFKFYGWIWGENKECKNCKGKVVEVKQYARDYRSGSRRLEKVIKVK